MAELHDLVVDCLHPAALARFWAATLDGYEVAPYGEDELDRLRSQGIASPEDDPSVLVVAPGVRPRLFFNRVPEPKRVKNRLHLDLRTDDVDTEVRRLVALGAQKLAEVEDWVIMADRKETSSTSCLADGYRQHVTRSAIMQDPDVGGR